MTLTMTRRAHLGLFVSALGMVAAGPAMAQVVGTPANFSASMTTSASKQAVYAFWADPNTWSRWDPQIASVSMNGPMRVGARGKLKGVGGPDSNIEIIALEPGVRFAFAATGPGLRIVFDRRFETGDATRFTHSVSMSGAMAGFLAPRVGARIQQGLPATMLRLKAMAERG
jgi:uncharacterized protein YndB with AHSA1/START domain